MKSFLFLIISFTLHANEHDMTRLLNERSQLESVSAELQSEIRLNSGERDRMNEKILNAHDEIKDLKHKLVEAKEKRNQFLAQISKKENVSMPLNRSDIESTLKAYEVFVTQGIPWDIRQRLDKLKAIKMSLTSNKEPLSESVLQLSQFLEAERKLSSETQRRLHRINIETTEQDAAIFRMGLTALYYKTAQGQTGLFYRKNQRLFHQIISDEKTKSRIIQLVEATENKNADRLLSELVLTPGMLN